MPKGMEMKKCLALALLVLTRCADTIPETVISKTVLPETVVTERTGTIHIRPIFVFGADGDTPWTLDRLEAMAHYAREVFALANFYIDMKPVEHLARPDLRDVNDDNVEELCTLSQQFAEVQGELAVFFVDSFVREGVPYSGLAFFPNNGKGDPWRHGVFVAQRCYDNTLAHELGHAFGLHHPWQDDTSDTQITDPEDCEAPLSYCNVMHICGRSTAPECLGQELTDGQIQQIRSYITQSPRDQVVSWALD